MRVLLADGAHNVRWALRTLLVDDLGMEVVGEVADLRALRVSLWITRPDLLIVDWALLGSRAGAVLARLCVAYPRLRAIVLSCEPAVQRRALVVGAHAFACKAAGPEELIAALRATQETDGSSDMTGGHAG
jgi:DNA-binding NarL/FixJ family response regulator